MRTVDKNREFVEWLLDTGTFKTKLVSDILKQARKFEHTLEKLEFLTDKEYQELQSESRVLVIKMNRCLEEIRERTEFRIRDADGTYDIVNLEDVYHALRLGRDTSFYVHIQMEGIVGDDIFTSITEKVNKFTIDGRFGDARDEVSLQEFKDIARAVADEMTYRMEIDKALDTRNEERFHRLVTAYKKKHGMK